MIIASIIFFALAALLGVTMLTYLLKDKHIPKGLAVLHAPLAVTGLLLLVIYSLCADKGAWTSITFFVVAAIGGLILLHRDLVAKAPKWLGVVHGLAAVAGFLLLLGFAYSNS
jgi:hypothetical protein